MIRKVYGIALVLGLALSLGGGGPIGCGDDPTSTGGKGGSGGIGGTGGTGGIGGSAGCPGKQSCGRVLDCECIAAECNEDTGAWECPTGYPLDRCPSEAECEVDTGNFCDCSVDRMPGGLKRGLGACCVADQANDDCAPGYVCFNGYCSTPCEDDADCGGGDFAPQTPSPFPETSTLSCVPTSAGKWCLAGSADECNAPDDCEKEGEVCTFIMSDRQDGSGSNRCMAAYCTEGAKPLGEACDPNEPYDCEAPTTIAGGQLFPACFSGRCSAGCDPNDTASCGEELTCLAVLTTNTGEKTAGICGGADCGFAENLGQFTEPREERIEQDACPEGEWCDLGVYVGTGQQLMCTPNDPEGTKFAGEECQLDEKLGQLCAEGYCIINLPDEGTKSCRTTANCPGENEICIDSDGNRVAHCTEAGPPGECGLLCANDGDCQEGAFCMRYQNIFQVGNRLEGIRAGICARPEHWYGDNLDDLEVCTSEQDCTKTGDSCNYQWVRSAFALCGIAADGDRAGKACEEDDDCSGDLRCAFVLNAAQTAYEGHCTDLSDLKSVGEACTAHDECKSQSCIDSENRDPQGGRRTFCGSACATSAECGENMACRTLQLADNSTAPTGDDSLVGYCMPRGPSSASNACEVEGDCKSGLKCEAATGQCYDPEALIGDVCRGDDECPMGAICEDEDRVCVIPGCDPAAETPCPEGSVCAKGRGPVFNCVAG